MLPVLDLHPMLRPASLIWAVAMLRDKALKPELAGFAKQVRPDLTLPAHFQKEARDTGWLSVMSVRIVWISSVDKAGVGAKKSFYLTDRFGDHALRLAGQKLVL
jgi:hypothetical protein